jgi:hypothetical protein
MIINPREITKGQRDGAVLWLLYIAYIFRRYFSAL